jgi:hypothetical protein
MPDSPTVACRKWSLTQINYSSLSVSLCFSEATDVSSFAHVLLLTSRPCGGQQSGEAGAVAVWSNFPLHLHQRHACVLSFLFDTASHHTRSLAHVISAVQGCASSCLLSTPHLFRILAGTRGKDSTSTRRSVRHRSSSSLSPTMETDRSVYLRARSLRLVAANDLSQPTSGIKHLIHTTKTRRYFCRYNTSDAFILSHPASGHG